MGRRSLTWNTKGRVCVWGGAGKIGLTMKVLLLAFLGAAVAEEPMSALETSSKQMPPFGFDKVASGSKPAPAAAAAPIAATPTTTAGTSSADFYKCEICITVLERKETHQHLCAGLEYYHETCYEVMTSLLHWDQWVVYWLHTGGCHRISPVGLATAKPCPAHVVCSWITSPVDRQPFCPPDHTYRSPGVLPMPMTPAGTTAAR